jgi:hypothetical protein
MNKIITAAEARAFRKLPRATTHFIDYLNPKILRVLSSESNNVVTDIFSNKEFCEEVAEVAHNNGYITTVKPLRENDPRATGEMWVLKISW